MFIIKHIKLLAELQMKINKEKVMTDTFRKQYKPLTEAQIEYVEAIKTYAENLETILNKLTLTNHVPRYIGICSNKS